MNDTPRHIIYVGAFIVKDGRLLAIQRGLDEGHLPGYWSVPGGKVDIETDVWHILEESVSREVMEETGVVIGKEMRLFANNSFTRTDGEPMIAMNFLCEYVSGDPQPLDGTADVRWVTEDELSALKIEENTLRQMKLAFSTAD